MSPIVLHFSMRNDRLRLWMTAETRAKRGELAPISRASSSVAIVAIDRR